MHLVSTDTFIYMCVCVCKDWFLFLSPKDEWAQAQKAQYNKFVESGLKS